MENFGLKSPLVIAMARLVASGYWSNVLAVLTETQYHLTMFHLKNH